MADRRTVISGVGAVSGFGLGSDSLAAGLRDGKNAVGDITLFDPSPYGRERGAEVRDFDVEDYVTSQQAYLDRSAELTFAAMHIAIKSAGLDMTAINAEGTGLVLGSAWGCQDTASLFFSDVIEKGPRFAKPFLFPHTYANTVISLVAMEYGLTGFHMHLASGAVAGAHALAKAFDLVRTGRQDIVFAGGFEALSETRMAAATARGMLAGGDGVEEACMPFDRNRGGTVLGEGSAILVVEELEHAKGRGAEILGEITAVGVAGTAADAMKTAGAGEGTDCIIAGANGCRQPDQAEMAGLESIPEVAEGNIPVVPIKSMLGDTEGAAGPLHAAAALAVIRDGFLPAMPVLNDPTDEVIDFVVGETRDACINRVMVSTVGAGGNAVCMAIEKAGQ